MSASDHDAAALNESRAAAEHKAQFDPDAGSMGTGGCLAYCFETWSNPTTVHAQKARRHRLRAAKHRRASQTLRDAEAKSCVGIAERDRDVSPFFHLQDIVSVIPGSDRDDGGELSVEFRAITGVDLQAMQLLVDCHAARNAALGHEVPEMEYCPLVPRGVLARVEERAGGLAVVFQTDEALARTEVRARLLNLESRRRSGR